MKNKAVDFIQNGFRDKLRSTSNLSISPPPKEKKNTLRDFHPIARFPTATPRPNATRRRENGTKDRPSRRTSLHPSRHPDFCLLQCETGLAKRPVCEREEGGAVVDIGAAGCRSRSAAPKCECCGGRGRGDGIRGLSRSHPATPAQRPWRKQRVEREGRNALCSPFCVVIM